LARAAGPAGAFMGKSFLVLFYKKELLSYDPLARRISIGWVRICPRV
jgi:hypothetical protein